MESDKLIENALRRAQQFAKVAQEDGLIDPQLLPAGMVMVGLKLLETETERTNIASWLYKLADEYSVAESKPDSSTNLP